MPSSQRSHPISDLKAAEMRLAIRAPLKIYQDRDEYNFDFEQGDSVHRRAGSHSCADQRSSEPKLFRFERLATCCALAALLSPRQGFQPNRWRESLACITANWQSRHMGGFQRCPLMTQLPPILSSSMISSLFFELQFARSPTKPSEYWSK